MDYVLTVMEVKTAEVTCKEGTIKEDTGRDKPSECVRDRKVKHGGRTTE